MSVSEFAPGFVVVILLVYFLYYHFNLCPYKKIGPAVLEEKHYFKYMLEHVSIKKRFSLAVLLSYIHLFL